LRKGGKGVKKKKNKKYFFHLAYQPSRPEKSGMEDTYSKLISKRFGNGKIFFS